MSLKSIVLILGICLVFTSCRVQENNELLFTSGTVTEICAESYNFNLKISSYDETKLTAEQLAFADNVIQNFDEDKLKEFYDERAEFYGADFSADNDEILMENIVFHDFDMDGTDEFMAELNFEMINMVSYYAVCYNDNGKTDFVTNGFTHNRIIHHAFVDSQPFIIIAEAGMGEAEPILKAEQVFTLVNGSFEPYTDSEKDIFVFLGEKGNKLFLFDKSDSDACPMDEKIKAYEYFQQLSFKDGVLTVTDMYESSDSASHIETCDFLSLGYEKGMHYKEICAEYFHTSAHIHWTAGDEDKQFSDDDERMYIPITGLAQNDETLEMSYSDIKAYFAEMGISENAFEQFKEKAYGAYYEFDGQPYVGVKDGGMWGWDSAYIDSFTQTDSGEVVYSCVLKGDSSYPETKDKTQEFTFSLKKNGDVWELYDCSEPYLFAAYLQNKSGD